MLVELIVRFWFTTLPPISISILMLWEPLLSIIILVVMFTLVVVVHIKPQYF